jgi:hypothetical protein
MLANASDWIIVYCPSFNVSDALSSLQVCNPFTRLNNLFNFFFFFDKLICLIFLICYYQSRNLEKSSSRHA